MSTAVIYKITNEVNGNSYVGVTTNFYNRMKSHKTCGNYRLKAGIKKYGWESFSKVILLKASDKYCYSLEDSIIGLYGGEYNIAKGGEGRRKGDVEGVDNPAAKLSESSVLDIRRAYSLGGTNYPELAAKYGVCKSSIGDIVTGNTWRHLGGPTSTGNTDSTRVKLTRKDVEDIRYAHRGGGLTYPQIAEIYHVDRSTVGDIIRGKTWQ